MHSTDTSPFFKIPFALLYYNISLLLLIFLTQLMSLHLKWFVQLSGFEEKQQSNAVKAGRFCLAALCECPCLCSQRPLDMVTLFRGVYLRN